jgi:methylglyoxal synthase
MQKTIELVAHDHKNPDLVKWSLVHKAELSKHKLVATITTGVFKERMELGCRLLKDTGTFISQ